MSGFFVIYLVGVRDYKIFPMQWIYDLKFERIVNYTINSGHKYRCFYSNQPQALVNGEPSNEYAADFNLPLQNQFGLGEACYFGLLLKFFREYFISLHN
jgi:hypothetical protein